MMRREGMLGRGGGRDRRQRPVELGQPSETTVQTNGQQLPREASHEQLHGRNAVREMHLDEREEQLRVTWMKTRKEKRTTTKNKRRRQLRRRLSSVVFFPDFGSPSSVAPLRRLKIRGRRPRPPRRPCSKHHTLSTDPAER
jgi:hypothetical protein